MKRFLAHLLSVLFPEARRRLLLLVTAILIGVGLFAWHEIGQVSDYAFVQDLFATLREVREERKIAVQKYLAVREAHVLDLARDPAIAESLRRFSSVWEHSGPKSPAYSSVESEFAEILAGFASRYDYYDVFLIDGQGRIVYTLKKEDDFGADLDCQPYRDMAIGQCYRLVRKGLALTDIEEYAPSGVPSQFLGAPVLGPDGEMAGCLAFQLSFSYLNNLMVDRSGLGDTGEGYVVRRDRKMLTESRFVQDAVLKQVVDTAAARNALKGHAGEEIIQDYRGEDVLSSYTFVDIGKVRWAVIVEMDLEEATLKCDEEEYDALMREVAAVIDQALGDDKVDRTILDPEKRERDLCSFFDPEEREFVEVPTGGYGRAEEGQVLYTKGVASCTAVTFIGEESSYLAHLTPVDQAYGIDAGTRAALGERVTDLTGEVLHDIRVRSGDSANSVKAVTVGIIAVSDESFPSLVRHLQQEGVRLTQIRFIFNRGPRCATVVLDPATRAVFTQWRLAPDAASTTSEKFYNTHGVILSVSQVAARVLRQRLSS